jgi:hypothetical protein
VPYLAALEGVTGRTPAPLLRPPRRLFPLEPPPVEPFPPPLPPADERAVDPPMPERIGPERVAPAPAALERARLEPAEVVPPVRTPRPETPPPAPSPAAPPVEEVVHPPAEVVPPSRRLQPDAPPLALEPVTAMRAPESPPPARHEAPAAEPKPAGRERERSRTVVARRSIATLEPSRLRTPATSALERSTAASRPAAAAAARAPGLHIGSIEVTVAPPPATPREPAFQASPAPVHAAPAPFASRDASTSRWFGLAQR